MRGSPYFQSTTLISIIFCAGVKKEDRINTNSPYFGMISSYQTASSYRRVFENLLLYLREHWKIKDCEQISESHILAYIEYKAEYYPSRAYLEKIISAIGKLEVALNRFSQLKGRVKRVYDFSKRQEMLDHYKNSDLLADNYHNRAYPNPELLIESLSNPMHCLAARIQYEGGARYEGVGLIKHEQLQGVVYDKITEMERFEIITIEKGGKRGPVLVSKETYEELLIYLSPTKHFKIDRQAYYNDIRNSCERLSFPKESSHGFRWNFCRRRIMEYAKAGYTYEQSLQAVSWEMKHNRACITEHYLG